MKPLDLTRIPEYYHKYVNLVDGNDLNELFSYYPTDTSDFLQAIPDERWDYRYAAGKWSIKELVQHMIDTERIFNYRALCFARKETTSLPGFDENNYAAASNADKRDKESFLDEIKAVGTASALLFKSFDEEQLERQGVANGKPVYVRGIGFIILGHTRHHLNILKERYLP